MKKLLTVITTLTMLIGCANLTAFAEETEGLSADVYVTVSNKGTLTVTQEKITVTDIDGDNALTVNDALYCAHEEKFEGGAEAGYASAYGDYGLSLNKLWGDNSGSFGYYVNNASAWSLADEVKDGDYLSAFVYSDGEFYSDMYCWFDVTATNADTDEEITLILSGAGYDADWNPVTVSVEGAAITLNGEKTRYKTDKDGKVTIAIDAEGTYVISAVSDTQILVPPVCKATVSAASAVPSDDTGSSANDKETSPQTGDNSNIAVYIALIITSIGALTAIVLTRKKSYEK